MKYIQTKFLTALRPLNLGGGTFDAIGLYMLFCLAFICRGCLHCALLSSALFCPALFCYGTLLLRRSFATALFCYGALLLWRRAACCFSFASYFCLLRYRV